MRVRLLSFDRRKKKILLILICGGVVLLWQLLSTNQPLPNNYEVVEPFPNLFKKRLPTLKKVPGVFYLNTTPVVLSQHQSPAQVEENFFRYLESKDVRCSRAQRLGHPHDGGWNVCLSPPYGFRKPCIVFSFGVGHDWQFDEAISFIHKCRVYSYDPSMEMAAHDRDENIHFEPSGLGGKGEIIHTNMVLKTFKTYLRELKLTHHAVSEHLSFRFLSNMRSLPVGLGSSSWQLIDTCRCTFGAIAPKPIDYLKFDIEHSEWAVLETMSKDGSLKNVRQLGFEIHTLELFHSVKLNVSTNKSDYLKMYRLLRTLELQGFRRYDHRENPFGQFTSAISQKKRPCCYELYYLNMKYYEEYQQEKEALKQKSRMLFE